ncbi:MFS transporter [Nocardioides endophyticus]|uniref:MFS transporter n=1 Tax=Nocardioides endophyticus TaxID=1353775 RepID=UPI0031E63BE5
MEGLDAVSVVGTRPDVRGGSGRAISGVAVAGYYLVSAVVSPLGGRLVGRLGPGLAMRLACGGASLGLVGIAVASDAHTIVIALTLLGLPNALVQPAANQVLSDTVPVRRQGVAFGLVQSAIPSATLLSGVLLAVFGSQDSWRAAVWSVVALTLAAQLLIRLPAKSARMASDPSAPLPSLPAPVGGAPLMVGLVVGAVLASVAATSLPSFVASTGAARGLTPAQVAVVQVVGSLACIGLRVLAAWRGSLLPGARMLGGVAGMLLVGTAGYALLATSSAVVFGVGVVVAYAFGWGWNGLFNLSVSRARAGRVSGATGLTQGGVFLGGVVGPLLFAWVLDTHGLGAAWLVVAGGAIAASLSIVYAVRRWAGAGEVEVR